ncbi:MULTISPECIES: AraC family transcriptional regulator [unclassified Bradyrhizobium]|uniref:AraC family transcriptional regulator n=1 Tax=unclassified Bradyrhizobium TaxID=2631580 RepID=UPI002479208C|nr:MULTISPECIES: AraC family transcriptional regulator [unclassified Bradyrhizobium]WGR68777.1 AraC family transcriptional regulator [Bradyrhizobium sp. ISRA426]WGR80832.1 AraC family transcriptional regulator [Bradyrhizobium sp. ISRA430]WGR84017.1 AraC family transcriptional regulator [Bradyrhizobium sp. ISRA432]
MDWLSRLFEMMPVRGRLDLRCAYGAPWRIEQGPGEVNEIPYHAVLAGSAMLENPAGGRPLLLKTGDILLLPGNPRHVMHDGSGAAPLKARNRAALNFTISENPGSDERLDLLCGHFAIAPPHDRLLRSYLPPILIVNAGAHAGQRGSAGQVAGLVALMRGETAKDQLGGLAMLNALSTAMFALVLRLASETGGAPRGLLALAGHPRLAPAVAALFNEPARAWTLPALARLCNMSRATLARLFQEKLGRSPSGLLTDIRMILAANQLRTSSISTGAVGEAVGYQSEAAFQRAFKSHMGVTPAQWRKTQEPPGRDVFASPAVTDRESTAESASERGGRTSNVTSAK